VKRSGKEEPMWIVIYMCMETMLRISLYSYLYLKIAKMLSLSYLLFFSSTKSENKRAEQVLPRGMGTGVGKVAKTVYTHVGKYKNNKRREKMEIEGNKKKCIPEN
jgi:hypothetical protein